MFLLVVSSVDAQLPDISRVDDTNGSAVSVIEHNGDYVIIGSNYGQKVTPKPMLWDDFENGIEGVDIADNRIFGDSTCSDCWTGYASIKTAGAERPRFSAENNKQGSRLCSKHHLVIDGRVGFDYSDSLLAYMGPRELTNKVFVSFWVRWNWGNTTDSSYQHKLFRMVNGNDFLVRPGIMLNCFHKTGSELMDTYNFTVVHSDGVQENPNELKHGSDLHPFGDQKWGIMQMWVKGAPENGEVHARFLNVDEGRVSNKDWVGPTLKTGSWKNFLFGWCAANVEDPATLDTTYYFDDIYIDDSWARIEIGNNAQYANCTHLEMQIPKVWASDSISFTVNQGSFNNGERAYLFVINENGAVSDGQEITFCGGDIPCLSRPKNPSALRIQGGQ